MKILLLLCLLPLSAYANFEGDDALACQGTTALIMGQLQSVNPEGVFRFFDREGNLVLGNLNTCTIIVDKSNPNKF